MSAALHKLANGLTVAVDPMPQAESAAIAVASFERLNRYWMNSEIV